MTKTEDQQTSNEEKIMWLPLESNPDILNKIIHENGVNQDYSFVDVYGLDDDALASIPRPVVAFIFLFPDTPNYIEFRKKDDEHLKLQEQNISGNVTFFKQTIGNACGMMALIHCLANNQFILNDGLFKRIMSETEDMSPQERGEYLESCSELAAVHEISAKSGQSHTPELGESVMNHFICFVNVDNHIYEMDGSREHPVNHGKTSNFVTDTVKIMKEFINRDPNENEFNVIALIKTV